ncbi:2-oxoglutarate ferredoxin oxidoreductase subunit gamma [Anaerovirgula multivorans]|uniref:2-oxoglutarate ferredoxin oxidoreductase subunit gamma n=1 Tax=Anaerovirgula multivorans TaxID=312168 RepID=A0A239J560_9FIRM|nr:2-oxoacid:acceptor oxidoreductase family protein [Anaerovirgula multivorans]SNT00945.1 2-oxoglutarate ferredoxin oxidoreductase subunit gamma [Anaerovirgula multivorans]
MTEKIIMAGFGGQGVMAMGQLLTYTGMVEEKNVSWLPSYGPEMRGGTANCAVIISESLVDSPIITEDATAAIVMNLPSLVKFEGNVIVGGNLLINSSLISLKTARDDVNAYYIPANKIANEIGNSKVANIVMLGAYLELTKVVLVDTIVEAMKKVFGPAKQHLVPLNQKALELGAVQVK